MGYELFSPVGKMVIEVQNPPCEVRRRFTIHDRLQRKKALLQIKKAHDVMLYPLACLPAKT